MSVQTTTTLTYILTTTRLDAMGQRWVADLAMYNFIIKVENKTGMQMHCPGYPRTEMEISPPWIPWSCKLSSPEMCKIVVQSQKTVMHHFLCTPDKSRLERPRFQMMTGRLDRIMMGYCSHA